MRLHTEKNLAPSVSSLERHHFHLHHGDFVRVDVTSTNRAETSCSVTSDGVTVDLTDPKMLQLVDGDNLQHDKEYTVSVTASPGWNLIHRSNNNTVYLSQRLIVTVQNSKKQIE